MESIFYITVHKNLNYEPKNAKKLSMIVLRTRYIISANMHKMDSLMDNFSSYFGKVMCDTVYYEQFFYRFFTLISLFDQIDRFFLSLKLFLKYLPGNQSVISVSFKSSCICSVVTKQVI